MKGIVGSLRFAVRLIACAAVCCALIACESAPEVADVDTPVQPTIFYAGYSVEGRPIECHVLGSGPDPAPDAEALVDMLVDKALEKLGRLLPAELVARARYAGIEALAPERLAEAAGQWLRPLLEGRRDLAVGKGALTQALLNLLDWDARQRLDRIAPRAFVSPAGTAHAIDYAAEGGPTVEVRVQALFGLDQHPMIGDTPLLLQLTSPAGRPIQATRDLPGFWRGSWRDVVREMKGRYPKHRCPDEPWSETPSLKTKNAFSRSQS